jgi:hypothetical protein
LVTWSSEDHLLAEMVMWEPLPEKSDPRWDAMTPEGDAVWADFERLLAAADATGEHGWRRAAVKVFEYASDWDLHGAMQGVRHGPERAFVSMPDGEDVFARELEPLSRSPRAGTRLWVVRELGILRSLSSLPFLADRLRDPHPSVAEEAARSVRMLAQVHPVPAELLASLPAE